MRILIQMHIPSILIIVFIVIALNTEGICITIAKPVDKNRPS